MRKFLSVLLIALLLVPCVSVAYASTIAKDQNETSTPDQTAKPEIKLSVVDGNAWTYPKKTVQIVSSDANVTWKSSNKRVATVSASGVVKGVRAGSVTITATDKADKSVKASIKIKVLNAPTKIKLNKTKVTLYANGQDGVKLAAKVSPSGAKYKSIAWSSSNPKVAAVGSDGTVKALSDGKAVITAKTDAGKSASCTITVKTLPTKIAIDPAQAELKVKKKLKLAKMVKIDGSETALSWKSSNKKIATVSSSGVVTAKKAGVVTITAKTRNGLKAECSITVSK